MNLTDYRLELLELQKQYDYYDRLANEPIEVFTDKEYEKVISNLRHSKLALDNFKRVIKHLEKID